MHLKNRCEFRSSKDHPNKHPKELFTKRACLKRIDYQLRGIICRVLKIQKRSPKVAIQNNRDAKLQQITCGIQKFNRKIKHYISSVRHPDRKLRGNKMAGFSRNFKMITQPKSAK
jgi:hypothetical protein